MQNVGKLAYTEYGIIHSVSISGHEPTYEHFIPCLFLDLDMLKGHDE